MKIDVYFTPAELANAELPRWVAVVDALRATSSIVEALTNGARAVFPVGTADDAARIAQNVGRDSVLLCGERKGLPIEGFDLGNAPAEFGPDTVGDLSLVMTTSNGTRAFLAVDDHRAGAGDAGEGRVRVLVASFLNLSAVARALTEADADGGTAAIVCAGREGRFGLDDALCAGAVIRSIEGAGLTPELNDAGRAARGMIGRKTQLAPVLAETAAGRHLEAIGHGDDIEFCARVDRTDVVPRFRDRKITVE